MILGCVEFYPFREDLSFLMSVFLLVQAIPQVRIVPGLPNSIPPNECGLLSSAPLDVNSSSRLISPTSPSFH
jgi:hypothetical protein